MIHKFLEMKLQTNIYDNALIGIDQGSLSDIIGAEGKWQAWEISILNLKNGQHET